MARRVAGYTLIELVVVCGVVAILASVAVPGLAAAHARATVSSAAAEFSVALRTAQVRAWVRGEPVRVSLTGGGTGYVVECGAGASCRRLDAGSFAGASCDSNYPAQVVEFVPAGFPHVVDGPARAGTFTISCGGETRRVVVQMGGAVRCP